MALVFLILVEIGVLWVLRAHNNERSTILRWSLFNQTKKLE